MKIYARQIDPEFQTSPLEYDEWYDDIIIDGNSNFKSFTIPEYDNLNESFDNMIEEWSNCSYHSIEDLLRDYEIKPADGTIWMDSELIKWREIIEDVNRYDISKKEFIRVALELITDSDWKWEFVRGSSQSDWNECLYNSKKWTRDGVDWVESAYFNTGTEWIIDDKPETPATPDDINGCSMYLMQWDYNDIRNCIAADNGVAPEDVILYAFDGYTRTPKYKGV